MSDVTYLTLQEALEQEGGALYVLNISDQSHPPGGDVYLNIPRINGAPISMTVPLTWLPQELSNKAPRHQILDSSYFMDALSNGLLAIIDTETARRIQQQPGADVEYQRLKQFTENVKAATTARGIGKRTTFTVIGRDDEEEAASAPPAQRATGRIQTPYSRAVATQGAVLGAPGQIDVRASAGSLLAAVNGTENAEPAELPAQFRGWVTNLGTVTEAEAAQKIVSKNTLSKRELEYMREHVTHPNIKNWCNEQLS